MNDAVSTEELLLLCFRGSKHYWPLCIRQLVLLPGMSGESFPYRKDFVAEEDLSGKTISRGLICMKFDASEIHSNAHETQSIYIPLRFVTSVEGDFAKDSTLRYFRYVLNSTVDYRGRELTCYSAGIRQSVLARLASLNLGSLDNDRSLVIRIRLAGLLADTALPGDQESDRWIWLGRLLASYTGYRGLKDETEVQKRYSDICYVRVSRVESADKKSECEPHEVNKRRQLVLSALTSYRLELLSNITPQLASEKSWTYLLLFDPEVFDVIDQTAAVSKGILRHEFSFHCRRPQGHTQIKFAPSTPSTDLYFPDVNIPVRVSWSLKYLATWAGPFACIFLGIMFGMVGVLASARKKPFDSFVFNLVFMDFSEETKGFLKFVLNLLLMVFSEEIKGFLKFLGIVLSSAGGVWAYYLQHRK